MYIFVLSLSGYHKNIGIQTPNFFSKHHATGRIELEPVTTSTGLLPVLDARASLYLR